MSGVTETQIVPAFGRDFRLYAGGRAVSVAGDRIALIALVFLVVRLSHAWPPALAVFYVARVLPSLLGGLAVGVIVDRIDRRALMIVADCSRAVLIALVPAISGANLWSLFVIVGVLYALTLLFDTAATSALPDIVPEARLTAANAVLQTINTAGDIGYAVGGLLVYALTRGLPFYLDSATFLISAASIFAMRIPVAGNTEGAPRSPWMDVREGLSYLFSVPFLRWTTIVFAVAPFAGGVIYVLTPLYAARILSKSSRLVGPLHSGAVRFSVLEVALGVGAVAGSWAAVLLGRRYPRGAIFGVGILLGGASYAALATTSNLYVAAALIAAYGVCNSLFLISGMTLVQQLTPTAIRGRVIAGRVTIIDSAVALGAAAGGALLLVMSLPSAWLLAGGLIAVSSLFVWLPREVRSQR